MDHNKISSADGLKSIAPLCSKLTVYDEDAKMVYHINSFYLNSAPEMGAVLDTITLEKAERIM